MDSDSQPISNSPYYVIRTEKYPIHSVCVGSALSVFTSTQTQNVPLHSSSTYKEDLDPETAFEASQNESKPQRQPQFAGSKGILGFGNQVETISAPVGSKGIFDSSSDEESIDRLSESPESSFLNRNSSSEHSFGEVKEKKCSFSSTATLSHTRLIISGSSNGTLSLFESGSGRLLDRVENAHGQNSILLVEELRIEHISNSVGSSRILIASQGRDGYVRFWSVALERGTTPFATFPEFSLRGERVVLRPHSSPVFVGGEAFCKASFNKADGLVATTIDRGAIAVWDFENVLNRTAGATGDVPFAPKCIITYEGDTYGMCMSLQLLPSSEKREMALLAGFEDGSVLAWSLAEIQSETTGEKSSPQNSLLYTMIGKARPFATTPVLSLSARKISELLHHQPLTTNQNETGEKKVTIDITNASDMWVGIVTSAEDTILTFCFSFENSDSTNSELSGEIKLLENYKTPHQGYGDAKIRCDSLVSVAGWDHRIRIFLLEAIASSRPSETNLISFNLRPLAILRHHAASVHSISLGEPETKLLASGSKDERLALWHIY